MFGRKNLVTGASEALDGASPYVDRLVHDEKFRERLVAAITAGAAARKRARRQAGLVGLAIRLGSDPVLRRQLVEVVSQLQKAQGRIEKSRSHKARNSLLLLTGAGAVAAAAIPGLREKVLNKVRGGSDARSDGPLPTPAPAQTTDGLASS